MSKASVKSTLINERYGSKTNDDDDKNSIMKRDYYSNVNNNVFVYFELKYLVLNKCLIFGCTKKREAFLTSCCFFKNCKFALNVGVNRSSFYEILPRLSPYKEL